MAKEPRFEIIVRNRKTGDENRWDADLYMLNAAIDDEEGVLAAIEGNIVPGNAVKVLMSADRSREKLFKNRPEVELLYNLRDKFFENDGEIDLSELFRMKNWGQE